MSQTIFFLWSLTNRVIPPSGLTRGDPEKVPVTKRPGSLEVGVQERVPIFLFFKVLFSKGVRPHFLFSGGGGPAWYFFLMKQYCIFFKESCTKACRMVLKEYNGLFKLHLFIEEYLFRRKSTFCTKYYSCPNDHSMESYCTFLQKHHTLSKELLDTYIWKGSLQDFKQYHTLSQGLLSPRNATHFWKQYCAYM